MITKFSKNSPIDNPSIKLIQDWLTSYEEVISKDFDDPQVKDLKAEINRVRSSFKNNNLYLLMYFSA